MDSPDQVKIISDSNSNNDERIEKNSEFLEGVGMTSSVS